MPCREDLAKNSRGRGNPDKRTTPNSTTKKTAFAFSSVGHSNYMVMPLRDFRGVFVYVGRSQRHVQRLLSLPAPSCSLKKRHDLQVETLNEALKIAAMDIAKVGVASSDAIEEPKHDGDGDDNGINRKGTQKRDVSSSAAESDANAQNARSGRADKARSSEVGSSGAARVGKTSRSSSSTSPASTNRDTGKIFVFHDGTFQVR